MQTRESNIFYRGKFQSGTLTFNSGIIEQVELHGPPKSGLERIVPGFIDIHMHGSCGYDFLSRSGSYSGVSKCLPRNGVTSFMPTLAAAPRELMLSSLSDYSEAVCDGSDAFAVHLEGPFISPARKGAQNPDYMRLPTVGELEDYIAASEGRIRLITVAPELPGSKEFIEHCIAHGIACSIGHTDADYGQALESFKWGITIVNHSYNAMTPLHHREPGVVGAMLLSGGVLCELIADGVHVSEGAIRLLVKNVGADHIVLITDGIMAQNGEDGIYRTEAFRFEVRDGVARLEDGTLAGSTLTMDRALRTMLSMTSLTLEEVVPMLSSIPCRAVGLTDRGEIETGKRADIAVLDESLNVLRTYVAGRQVYPA